MQTYGNNSELPYRIIVSTFRIIIPNKIEVEDG